MEFTLSFSDSQWICTNGAIEFVADSLEEIDVSIEKYLKRQFRTGIIEVKLFFDFDRFPQWHRQYMPHYFNRVYSLDLNKTAY